MTSNWGHTKIVTDDNFLKVGREVDFWVGSGPQGTFCTVSALAEILTVQPSDIDDGFVFPPPRSWKQSSVVDKRVVKVVFTRDMRKIMMNLGIGAERIEGMMTLIEKSTMPKKQAKLVISDSEEEKHVEDRPATATDLKTLYRDLHNDIVRALRAESRVAARMELQLDDAEMRKIQDEVRAQETQKIAQVWDEERRNILKRLRDEEVERQTPIIRAQVTEELTKRFKEELEPKLKQTVTHQLIRQEIKAITPAAPPKAGGLTPEEIRACLSRIQQPRNE